MAERDMLINHVAGEECRIALVEEQKLEELYTERTSDELHVGNIYRGKVTNVESSIQAAFIDFGLDRNGFLHISDLHPRYFPGGNGERTERVGKKTPRKERPPIQACLKRGQDILVQVLKEGIGTKGPTLTSYLSIPGRFLVMMPQMERHGVSRKVDDDDARREMRDLLKSLDPPEGFGFIVRTAGIGRTKTELKRDLAYLQRLWRMIEKRMNQGSGPAELYTESDLVIRTIRDVLSNDVKRVVIDDPHAAKRAYDFLRIAMPRGSTKVLYYDKPIPLFDAFDIEQQIEKVNARSVDLPSGGSLVIDQAEAMVAIDVNSGTYRDNKDAESTAFKTNCEAVDEIARQLRLRDLGGVVVLDLIDMYMSRHRREIERRFRDNLKRDRARSKVSKINEFGLMSLTRQRMRPSLKKSLYKRCPACSGSGHIRTAESVVIDAMRRLAVVLDAPNIHRAQLFVHPDVVGVLINRKKRALVQLERRLEKVIEIHADEALGPDEIRMVGFDQRDVSVDLEKLPRPKRPGFDKCAEVTGKTRLADLDAPQKPEAQAADSSGGGDDKTADESDNQDQDKPKRRRRRRRSRKSGDQARTDDQSSDDPKQNQSDSEDKGSDDKSASQPKRKGRSSSAKTDRSADTGQGEKKPQSGDDQAGSDKSSDAADENAESSKPKRRRRRGGRRRSSKKKTDSGNDSTSESTDTQKQAAGAS
jgi:ribonuclease E